MHLYHETSVMQLISTNMRDVETDVTKATDNIVHCKIKIWCWWGMSATLPSLLLTSISSLLRVVTFLQDLWMLDVPPTGSVFWWTDGITHRGIQRWANLIAPTHKAPSSRPLSIHLSSDHQFSKVITSFPSNVNEKVKDSAKTFGGKPGFWFLATL